MLGGECVVGKRLDLIRSGGVAASQKTHPIVCKRKTTLSIAAEADEFFR